MQQKLVINVVMNNDKSRSKAMKIAVGVHGVDSASLAGPDKTQIEVTGDGIDSTGLVTLLRRKVGFAELVSLGPVEEKNDDKPPEEDPKPEEGKEEVVLPTPAALWSYGYGGGQPHYVYQMRPYGDQYCYTVYQ
ncbi:Heavy metal-associated isoprenylated plant protein 16 [Linum grandiflorum]